MNHVVCRESRGGIGIHAVILAAGRGSRMSPLTDEVPKPLIPTAGLPIIERLISDLKTAGIHSFTIGVGWRGELIEEHLSQLPDSDKIEVTTVIDYELGPLKTIVSALEISQPERFLFCPADYVVDPTIVSEIISVHNKQSSNQLVTLGVDMTADSGAFLHLSEDGHVIGFDRTTNDTRKTGRSVMSSVAEGIFLEHMQRALAKGHTTVSSALNQLIGEGYHVVSVPVSGYWFDIDDFTDLLAANQHLLQNLKLSPDDSLFVPSGDTIHVDNRDEISPGITLGLGSQITGPTLVLAGTKLGPRCRVGPNVSLSRNTVLQEGCRIDNSILFGNALVSKSSKVHNAIVHGQAIFKR
ncbi:MAG: sugar phosphate nucleotidyltransferase [Candidatus Thorarchaeota archaeon]